MGVRGHTNVAAGGPTTGPIAPLPTGSTHRHVPGATSRGPTTGPTAPLPEGGRHRLSVVVATAVAVVLGAVAVAGGSLPARAPRRSAAASSPPVSPSVPGAPAPWDRLGFVALPRPLPDGIGATGAGTRGPAFAAVGPEGPVLVTADGSLTHLGGPVGLTERPVGTTGGPGIRAVQPPGSAPATLSAHLGRTRVRTRIHPAVAVEEVWPGVTVTYRRAAGTVERTFTVAPGADPDRIRIAFDGAASVSVDDDGSLVVTTPDGPVRWTAPVAHQPSPAGPRPVPVAWRTLGTVDGAPSAGLTVGPFDPTRELVIDPLLAAATFPALEGAVLDAAVAPTGEVVLVGSGGEGLARLATGTFDPTNEHRATNEMPGWVMVLSADLADVRAVTFFGGDPSTPTVTELTGVAVTASGDVVVVGWTGADDIPVVGPDKSTTALSQGGPGNDLVVAVFDPDLTGLRASAYISGGGADGFVNDQLPASRIVDAALNADGTGLYVAATTTSSDLPTNQGSAGDPNPPAYMAVDPHPAGPLTTGQDCWVGLLPLDLSTVNGTYLGNNDGDWRMECTSVGADTAGSVFVAGTGTGTFEPGISGRRSWSNRPDAPEFDRGDGVVVRLSADLRTLHEGTFLGGFGPGDADIVWDLAVTPTGEVVVGGVLAGEAAGFPTTPGAHIGGATDGPVGFVARLDGSLDVSAATLVATCPQDPAGGRVDCTVEATGGDGRTRGVGEVTSVAVGPAGDVYATFVQPATGAGSFFRPAGTPGAWFAIGEADPGLGVGPVSVWHFDGSLARRGATDVTHGPTGDFWRSRPVVRTAPAGADAAVVVALTNDGGLLSGAVGPAGDPVDPGGEPTDPAEGLWVGAFDADLAATGPSLTWAPADGLDAGWVPRGTTSAPLVMTLTNDGEQPRVLHRVERTLEGPWTGPLGTVCPDATLAAGRADERIVLAPGASCELALQLGPVPTDGAGTVEAAIVVVSDDPATAVSVSPPVRARISPLVLAWPGFNPSSSPVDYLGRGASIDGAPLTVTATARGSAVRVGRVTFADGADGFTLDGDTCSGTTLADGDSCTVDVRARGSGAALLVFEDPDGAELVGLTVRTSGSPATAPATSVAAPADTGDGGGGGPGPLVVLVALAALAGAGGLLWTNRSRLGALRTPSRSPDGGGTT